MHFFPESYAAYRYDADRRRDRAPETPPAARSVTAFWREAGPAQWFAKNPDFDRDFAERFDDLYTEAAGGALAPWLDTAEGALALVILLDQYPRNAFRGMAQMYATDPLARRIADTAIAAGHDRAVDNAVALFFYMPFAHSEMIADQARAVTLCQRLGEEVAAHARHHRDLILRFGRFPHRNPILGRRMTEEEQRFLDEGGYRG